MVKKSRIGIRLKPFFQGHHTIRKYYLLIWFVIVPIILYASGPENAEPDTASNANDTLIFVSDTQAPLFAETLIHKTAFNERATRMIFDDILRKKSKNVFLLGDIVAAGSKPKRWQKVDLFLDSIRNNNGHVWACLGNHEYIYNAKAGVQAFQKRFPDHSKTGYYVIKDSIAIVLMNSNFSKLSTAEQEKQKKYYDKTLKALNQCDSIKAIIVACHHSPYSNSKVVGSNKLVQETFVASFMKTPKCKLFLSGHSHNFEHFRIAGKTFLVIGGGGGINQPLNTKTNRIVCEDDDCHPLFHYLMVKRTNNDLILICREVNNDLKGFSNILNLKINLND
jgi:predicted phosphodiesterase